MPKVTLKDLPQSEIILEINISKQELASFAKKAALIYSKKNPLPGFRPGKATVEAVKKVAGEEGFKKEVLETAINKTFLAALLEKKLDIFGSPKIDVKENSPETGLIYEARISVFPEITLPDLKKLKFKKPNLEEIKITEEETTKVLDHLRKSRAKTVTVNREAKKGDLVEINFKLSFSGVPVEGGSSMNHPLVIGEEKFIPGFEDQLIGLKAEEKKNFSLDFPKDYYDDNLKGKKGEFEILMKLVQEQELPEVTDDFAKGLGRFTSAENLRESLRNNLRNEKEAKMIHESLEDLIKTIAEETKTEIPNVFVEEEKNKMLSELENQLTHMGLSLETYLEKVKTTKKALLGDWHDDAKKRVKTELALMTIGKEKEISATKEEIEKETEKLLNEFRQSGAETKDIDPERVKAYAENFLSKQKVIAWLKKEFLEV
jgi:trigger factor